MVIAINLTEIELFKNNITMHNDIVKPWLYSIHVAYEGTRQLVQ